MTSLPPQSSLTPDERDRVSSDEFQVAFGESLVQTLDLETWHPGENLASLYGRLEKEIEEAVQQEHRVRELIRQDIFPRLRTRPNAPRNAGVYQAQPQHIEHVHRCLLFNGAVEACDGTSVSHDTLVLTTTQIGVSLVSYQGNQGSWLQRLYRRDLRTGSSDPLKETLELLERRKKRDAYDVESRRDKLGTFARRGIMTYAERAILLQKSDAIWRMGHGNPIAFELLTGSSMADLIEKSLDLLTTLIEKHQRFVFVPSASSDRLLLTIGNALRPLEYVIVDTMEQFVTHIVDNGNYTGAWEPLKRPLLDFATEVASQVVIGVYRASPIAPAQVFYSHINHAHEAALIAMADSVLQEHRGFPMLIDLADRVCSSTFGTDAFNTSVQMAYAETEEPFQHFTERQTRH